MNVLTFINKQMEDFVRQFKALAWKNFILKTRYWGTLLLELGVPTMCIISVGILSIVLPAYQFKYSIPDSYVAIPSFRSSDPNNVFGTSGCSKISNIVWSCDKLYKDNVNCQGNFSTAFNFLSSQCQLRKIAIAPQSAGGSSSNDAAAGLVSWFNNNNTIFQSYDTFEYFSSEQEFLNYINNPGYAVDPSIQVFSAAVIISGGYPQWEYSLRMNQTITSVSELSFLF